MPDAPPLAWRQVRLVSLVGSPAQVTAAHGEVMIILNRSKAEWLERSGGGKRAVEEAMGGGYMAHGPKRLATGEPVSCAMHARHSDARRKVDVGRSRPILPLPSRPILALPSTLCTPLPSPLTARFSVQVNQFAPVYF